MFIPDMKRGLLAISPIIVFLCMYLVVSLVIGDFYKMPLSVALLAGSAWAVVINHPLPITKRIDIFSRQAGTVNVLYMVWIFILAGGFAALAKEIGCVDATVNCVLRILPSEFIAPGLFLAACVISLSIGTSVGTVVALTPLAVEIAAAEGGSLPFFLAVVLGGSFFGDNLSFISDTTIAATRTQGCRMSDKFRTNFRIVLPAALGAMGLFWFMGAGLDVHIEREAPNYWLIVPYAIVFATALSGINVTLVLTMGIASALVLGLFQERGILELLGSLGTGIDSMGNLIIVTLLAAGMLGLIKNAGGIDFVIGILTRKVRSARGAQGSIALLVGMVNLCTANNTVAILTVGELAADISRRFGLEARKTASILDTASCIVQSLIPYGAQTLIATGLAGVAPAAPWPYMYYSWMLTGMVVLSILVTGRRRTAGADISTK